MQNLFKNINCKDTHPLSLGIGLLLLRQMFRGVVFDLLGFFKIRIFSKQGTGLNILIFELCYQSNILHYHAIQL